MGLPGNQRSSRADQEVEIGASEHLPWQRQVRHFGHARVSFRAAAAEHQHRVRRDRHSRIIDAGMKIFHRVEDYCWSSVHLAPEAADARLIQADGLDSESPAEVATSLPDALWKSCMDSNAALIDVSDRIKDEGM
jgi:hypothetical protein